MERLTRAMVKERGRAALAGEPRKTKPVIGPVMRIAGRTLRRAGEGLEGWASPREAESDARWAERHTG